MTVSQQEQIYGDYMEGRQSGRTDAYGNQKEMIVHGCKN